MTIGASVGRDGSREEGGGLRRVVKTVSAAVGARFGVGFGGAGAVEFVDGGDVALEIVQAIGYRAKLKSGTIVSYGVQDYDFWQHGTLSQLVVRQLGLGADMRLITTPPDGRVTRAEFKRKYALLSLLDQSGVKVLLNDKVHAKAYLFRDHRDVTTTVVGSANLTGPGFGRRATPAENLVECAMVSGEPSVLRKALRFVEAKIVRDSRTEDYEAWFLRRRAEIRGAGL